MISLISTSLAGEDASTSVSAVGAALRLLNLLVQGWCLMLHEWRALEKDLSRHGLGRKVGCCLAKAPGLCDVRTTETIVTGEFQPYRQIYENRGSCKLKMRM